MTVRRRSAISPVIATVILIAVAVALGIAVAVWAGALTGNLQRTEKLIVLYASEDNGLVNLTVTNQSPHQVTISQIYFNGALVPPSLITGQTAAIPSATTAIVSLHNMSGQSGINYPVVVWLLSGGSYPVTVFWP